MSAFYSPGIAIKTKREFNEKMSCTDGSLSENGSRRSKLADLVAYT